MDMNKLYIVKNRSASEVIYSIPEDGIRRPFAPGETKRISLGELQKLGYQPGGREIMTNFLQIQEEEATEELGIHREVEYDMSVQQIVELLKSGSMDALLDALDFAPTGVIDLIKTFAVQLPLNDMEKCNAIKKKTEALQEITYALAAKVYQQTAPEENKESSDDNKKDDGVQEAEYEEK